MDSVLGKKLRRICNKLEKRGMHTELRGDGGYDARKIFSLLAHLGITPVIRIRIDAKSKGVDRVRALAAPEQFGGRGGCTNEVFNRVAKGERRPNQLEWKEDVEYGLRWIVEMVISAFMRVFGGSVRALKPHTAIIEISTKAAAYTATSTWRMRPSGQCASPKTPGRPRPPGRGPGAAAA